jgi:hypothetical protein
MLLLNYLLMLHMIFCANEGSEQINAVKARWRRLDVVRCHDEAGKGRHTVGPFLCVTSES